MDNDSQTTTQEWEATQPLHAESRPKGWRSLSLRARRIIAGLVAMTVLGGLVGIGLGLWYLDRFVIAHVEIEDVAAYEASLATLTTLDTVGTTTDTTEVSEGITEVSVPTVTSNTYVSDTTSITIEEVVVGEGDDQVTYFVADIVLEDVADLRTAFADNSYGTNITEGTSDIAESVDAVLAINGDYYGFRDTGIVIRNGVIYRDEPERTGLALYADGSMEIYDEALTSAGELLEAGVWNTWSFGPALLDDGEVVDGIEEVEVDGYIGKRSMQGEQPRTAIGMIDEGHYIFIVVDGRSDGYSRGMTLPELAELFQNLGCTVAYNLDGGGSATMYFNGELVNYPVGEGDERGTSDIIYIAG